LIISKAPTRITFAGGATDAKYYYEKKGGFLVAAGIDKYLWMMASRPYWKTIRLKYLRNEEAEVNRVEEIDHPLFRETLRFCGLDEPIELTCLSDVPPNCGLGTSSSFTVSLLNAVFSYMGHSTTKEEIAEIASCIEIEILKEPIGKQDQYMASFGGLSCLTFHPDGKVDVEELHMTKSDVEMLDNSLVLYDTGVRRSAGDIQASQYKAMRNDGAIFHWLDRIKDMAYETKRLLEKGKLDEWGVMLDDYWKTRKRMSNKISLPIIDEAYETARKNGALGGKLIGAGGGGFLMLYCPKKKPTEALNKLGLIEMPFSFDFGGAKTCEI